MTTLHLPANAPGPRGFSTKNHGDVLLQPGEHREDLKLSDDELERAKVHGIKSGKPGDAEEADGSPIAGGGARAGAGEGANEPGKLKAGEGPTPKGGEEKVKTFKDMNRTELDAAAKAAEADGFKLPEDATTNAKIADALQKHADERKA